MVMVKFFSLLLLLFCAKAVNGRSDTKHYIVYMGTHTYSDSNSVQSANHELLASVVGSIPLAKEATVYHYTKSFRGFSALLTSEQAHQLSKDSSVGLVIEDKISKLATSRSWDFTGSPKFNKESLVNKTTFATEKRSNKGYYTDKYGQRIFLPESSNVVVGVIDGGVWPEAASFSDKGLGPIPTKFKGKCIPNNSSFKCNRKIIGAHYYYKGHEATVGSLKSDGRDYYKSPRDNQGHGSNVATIAVGAVIRYTMEGLGDHTIGGMAPGARIAVYKACWWDHCADSDIIAAFDDAISDRVDIISFSVGPTHAIPDFFDDVFAKVTMEAFKKGIFVSAAGGNNGLVGGIFHGWPWMTTVAASTYDRTLITPILLGNSVTLRGYGINPNGMDDYQPIITGEQAAIDSSSVHQARFCQPGSLYRQWVHGNIVICEWDDTVDNNNANNDNAISYITQLGGAGVIFTSNKDEGDVIVVNPIICTMLSYRETKNLRYYLNYYSNPVARILSSTQVSNENPEPRMASFSNMGPNPVTPELIKPDVTAPGVGIVAGFFAGRHDDPTTPLRSVMSGTSMACPHVSGVAALIKDVHKDWSPAAIQSAIMTTAYGTDSEGNAISTLQGNLATPFNLGSGHLDSRRALDPGLVYDFGNAEIAEYMCGFATEKWVRKEFNMRIDCDRAQPLHNLNYPSISVASRFWPIRVTRTLTYVGEVDQPKVFEAEITAPGGAVTTYVEPEVIDFSNQKEVTYTLTFTPASYVNINQFYFGSITWKNSVYEAYSPISIYIEG